MTTIDVDPADPGLSTREDYYDLLATLRRQAPVHQYAPGSWTVACYDDVRTVSSDPARFCSNRGVLVNDPLRHGGDVSGSILHMDPPVHAPWRRLASRRFTSRAVADMEATVNAIATSVLDELAPGDEVDFIDAIASPFPVLVIAELLGVDGADREDFRRWSDAAISSQEIDHGAIEDLTALHGYLVERIEERRSSPKDDIVSIVATAEIDGRPVSTAEAVTYCIALLVAGNETTRHLLSGATLALFEHPDQRRLLGEQPALVPGAVEECLRWVTPIQAFARTATRDLELGGEQISEGDSLVMLYASANRDERAFGPTAGAFDVSRPVDTSHVAFGFGEHLCLGAALARLEGRLMLRELVERFPDLAVTGEPTWVRSTLVRGMHALPVVL